MDNIDLSDKKTQTIILLLFIIICSYIYFLFFQEEKYKVKIVKEGVPVTVEKVKEVFVYVPQEKIEEKTKVDEQKDIEVLEKKEVNKKNQIKEKRNILFRTSSMSHMHNIKVVSDIKIDKDDKSNYSFVGIEGNVINTDNVDGRFSISIRDDYLDYLSELYIEVEDKISKITSRCNASFLIGINKNDFYQFAFDNGVCYITDTKLESVFLKNMRKEIKHVHKMSEEEFQKLPKETRKKILERIKELEKEE